jgi:hypothetical protein
MSLPKEVEKKQKVKEIGGGGDLTKVKEITKKRRRKNEITKGHKKR